MKISSVITDLADKKLDLLFSEKNWLKQKNKREKKTNLANLFENENFQRLGYISHTATIVHGQFIEQSYSKAVSDLCNNLKVWKETNFKISTDSFDISGRQNNMSVLTAELPYGDVHYINKRPKTRSIDFLTFNEQTGEICSYEIKRGGSTHDSEKKEKIISNIIAVQVLLKNYGISKKLEVKKARSFIVSHFNSRLLPTEWKKLEISGDDIDSHFGQPVKNQILLGEEYFKSEFNNRIRKFKELLS